MGLKALGLTIVGLAKDCKAAKNISGVSNPFCMKAIRCDKFVSGFSKEETLSKLCAESGLAIEDVSKGVDSTSLKYLFDLEAAGKVKLCSPKVKERRVLLLNRNANDGLLLKKPDGILNYISSSNPEASEMLSELLLLEKEGKIGAENIAQILKAQKAGYGEECAEFLRMIKSGEAKNENVNHFLLMVENEIPLEILNSKNFSKYTKDDLRGFALVLQASRSSLEPGLLQSISRELNSLTKVNKVSAEVSEGFLKNFDRTAETFANSPHTVKELSKAGGIQLEYSRELLKTNILEKIKGLPAEEQKLILDKFGLAEQGSGIMSGFPVYSRDISGMSKAEIAVNEEIEKFLGQNKVILPKGFEDLEPAINNICETFPEFMFTIGSKQHKTHTHKLAEHILAAFESNVKNPMYKDLSPSDKRVLGIATILHDVNKIEKMVDKTHPLMSSQTANAIVHRMSGLSPAEQNRVINFVENHHWLERVASGEKFDPKTVEDLAFTFRSGNDFKMAQIFAESDLKAVNSGFFNAYGGKINSPMTREIEKEILNLQSKGRMVYTTDVTLSKAIESGAELKTVGTAENATKNYVISAKNLGLDTENIIYHAGADDSLICAASSCGYKKGLVLSASLGREGHAATFRGYDEFIGFRQMNMNNIGSAFKRNTKFGKSSDKFKLYYKKDAHFSNKIKEQLPFEISDEQYARVFCEASEIKLNEIHSNKNIQKILGGEAQAREFEKAVANVNKELESTATNFGEVVIADPELGFVGTKRGVENMSYELRKFCEENSIPIVEFH